MLLFTGIALITVVTSFWLGWRLGRREGLMRGVAFGRVLARYRRDEDADALLQACCTEAPPPTKLDN